jgi:hypothetical protein
MIKVAFELPEHDRPKLEGSDLGKHLRLSTQIPSLSHVDAALRVRPAEANPDLFLLFVQPNEPIGKLRAGYHYYSAHLPFLTREMFEVSTAFGRIVNAAFDEFRHELAAGEMIQIAGSPDRNHEAAIKAFAATLA